MRVSGTLLAPGTGVLCQGGSRVHGIPPGSYMKSPSTGVCERCAEATALTPCPETALGPTGASLTPKPLRSIPKALVQMTTSLWHRYSHACSGRSPGTQRHKARPVSPLLLPLNTYLCLGEAACWVCSAFDARVQNYDAAALESCLTSPTSCLQQGSGGFWHLQFSML